MILLEQKELDLLNDSERLLLNGLQRKAGNKISSIDFIDNKDTEKKDCVVKIKELSNRAKYALMGLMYNIFCDENSGVTNIDHIDDFYYTIKYIKQDSLLINPKKVNLNNYSYNIINSVLK